MNLPRRIQPKPGSILLPALAVAALSVATVGVGLLSPRATEAQSSRDSARRGFLGVSLQELDDDLRSSYGFKGSGALVADVTPGSPAEEVGIEEGDILVRLDDRPVSGPAQVTERVRALAPGALLGITVFRDGNTRYLGRATLADARTAMDDDRRVERRIVTRTPRAPRAPRTPRVAPAPSAPEAPELSRALEMLGGRGRLGVQTHDLDSDLGAYFDAPNGRGVLVLKVLDDTPAAKAGLKAGDVITGVGGKSVATTEELREALRDREAGDVELRILRNGSARTMSATLAEADDVFRFHSLPGGGDWMGMFEDDGDGKDGKDVRKRVFRFHGDRKDGAKAPRMRFEVDGHERMTPEERERFDAEMKELREDLRELRRELREMRDDRR